MKVTIDTENKTVEFHGNVDMGEMVKWCKENLPDWKSYTLVPNVQTEKEYIYNWWYYQQPTYTPTYEWVTSGDVTVTTDQDNNLAVDFDNPNSNYLVTLTCNN